MSRATVLINGIPHPADCGTLLSELLPLHRAMDLPCGGRGTCGKCRVTVSGEVSPLTDRERKALGTAAEVDADSIEQVYFADELARRIAREEMAKLS